MSPFYGSSVNTYRTAIKSFYTNGFDIYFINAAGVVVSSLDGFMDFTFSRNGTWLITPSVLSHGALSSANIWIYGKSRK
jgi:hypothetical protein